MIVPTRNGRRYLPGLVDALAAQSIGRARFEVIVGDDGSTDGSTDGLATEGGWIRVAAGPPQNSYAARNRAARLASAPVLAFCDADCRPDPTWLEAGLAALERAELVAGEIVFSLPDRPTIWTYLDIDTFKDHERQVRNANAETANLFVRRGVFEKIGGFDDSLPEHGDFEFVARCVAAGHLLVYEPTARVEHPTRDQATPFLRTVWIMHRWYAARETRAGRRPDGLKLRSWVPIVQTLRARQRHRRSLGLDRRRFGEHGITVRARDNAFALPLIYIVVPYLGGAAQLRGWYDGRHLR